MTTKPNFERARETLRLAGSDLQGNQTYGDTDNAVDRLITAVTQILDALDPQDEKQQEAFDWATAKSGMAFDCNGSIYFVIGPHPTNKGHFTMTDGKGSLTWSVKQLEDYKRVPSLDVTP